MISWGSPKKYQDKGSNPNHTPAKKPSWYCKKLKAKHNYIYKSTTAFGASQHQWIWENYECSGCRKQKTKDMKNKLNLNKEQVQVVCLDCGAKYKKKEKEVMGVWIGDCDICGAKQVSCAAAGHDFGIYSIDPSWTK